MFLLLKYVAVINNFIGQSFQMMITELEFAFIDSPCMPKPRSSLAEMVFFARDLLALLLTVIGWVTHTHSRHTEW